MKFRKFTTPVAVPLNSGGLASLMTVYGSIAAPEAMPGDESDAVSGEHARPAEERPGESSASSTAAPATMTGLRRPMRSETKPSSGQPIIQPSGTIDDRSTADA